MIVGYARVSTEDQNMDMQIQALTEAGCSIIHTDQGISGRSLNRSGLNTALAGLHPGDTLMVWRLDRLGRSLVGLVQLIEELGLKGVEFQSLAESIDTQTSGGRLVFHMMAALAEFERSLISERTKAGLAAAKQRGRRIGRPPSLTDAQICEAYSAVHHRGESWAEVAKCYGIASRTLRRILQSAP